MARTPESALTERILAALKKRHPTSWWVKFHGSAMTRAGVPDILGCVEGRFVALEVKVGRAAPRPVQVYELDALARAGASAHVVRSVEDALKIIQKM